MATKRRWFFVVVFAAAAVACGLDVTGVAPIFDGGAPADASTPDTATAPVDASRDVALDMEAAVPCVPDGGFCDYCDPTLILCIQFEGGIADKSRYAHVIDVDGSAAFITTPAGEAIALDGSVNMTALTPEVDVRPGLTIEVVAKIGKLPPDGGRSGFIDRDGNFGLFLHDDGSVNCSNARTAAGTDPSGPTHIACVIAPGRARIFYQGLRVALTDAGGAGASNQPIAIGRNSPSGDPFVGEIASLRIYTRAKTTAEIALAAGADASDEDDAGP